MDEDGLPELTEEERRWLNGETEQPDATAAPEQHKRFLEVQQRAMRDFAKRQRCG